jgi:outer membrane protein OmpA-like peptidoglycan-associated protein
MLNYLKAFSYFLLYAVFALTSHYFLNKYYFNHCNTKTLATSKKNTAIKKQFLLTDTSNKIVYSASKGFTITQQSKKVTSIDSFPSLIDSIHYILKNDYTKELHIIGKHTQNELINSPNLNLGFLRAKQLKKEIISKGIDSLKIKTFGEISNYTYKNNIFSNGIQMKFNTLPKNKIDSIETSISNKRLYLNFVNDSLQTTKKLEEYTFQLKQYLNIYPLKTITITGHTDNKGYYDKNLIIGLNNARTLKDYFIKNGIATTKIKTATKGESEPIADKTTEKGRALNRRIELKIN